VLRYSKPFSIEMDRIEQFQPTFCLIKLMPVFIGDFVLELKREALKEKLVWRMLDRQ
jgi:hypothetical protein